MTPVFFKSYDAPAVDRREIIRYMGARDITDEQNALLDECLDEVLKKLVYKVCWREVSVSHKEDTLDLEFAAVMSKGLMKNLHACDKAVLFAATIGLDMDRAIAKYSRLSPVKGLMMQAIGAERIESLCDAFNDEVKHQAEKEGRYTRSRFSPGYGDLPLSLQKDIFAALECHKKIGLTLNGSLLMSPTKSVTAIIGISDCPQNHQKEKCRACNKADCAFRE